MKLPITLFAAAASLCLGTGVAHAQTAPSAPSGQPPSNTGPANPAASVRDTSELDIMRDRDETITRENRRTRQNSAVPATPDQVIIGSDVHDIEGVEIGTIESVSASAAVVVSPGGKVEVPLEAFGTDGERLLIGIAKADFDAAVAAATAPAG
jgi:hypothetical protein